MQYFAEATDILQCDNIPTCNHVIPAVDSLENAIKSVNRENAAINAMCEALRNSLERRFSYLLQSAIHRAAIQLLTDESNLLSLKILQMGSFSYSNQPQ